MIPCPPRADLQDLLANRLPAERERLLLAHIEICSVCQQTLEEMTAVGAPGSRIAVARDRISPREEPDPEAETFWRELKALFPKPLSTAPSGLAGGRTAGGSTEDAAAALPQRLGRYELLEEIGRGGMGCVLRGHDPDLGRDLAVKVLLDEHQNNPVLVRHFVNEAQIGGQLQHPGLVPVHELGQLPDGRPFFAMKLVCGRTLAALLAERPDPGHERPHFLRVFLQVCQAVAYAHSRGVIHRDLKPSNVMVGAFGEVQVVDWGLAKVLAESRAESQERRAIQLSGSSLLALGSRLCGGETQPGSVVGTPAYLAPEQASGASHRLDARADVFGLGAMLCEILTGLPPYAGAASSQTVHRASRADLADAFARLDQCGADADLIHLARRCLAPQAEDRPDDAGRLAAELTAYLESVEARLRQAELAQAAARARAAEERKRRRLALVLAATVLLVGFAGAGAWLWWRAQRGEQERAVSADLEEVAARLKEWRLAEAHTAMVRAEGRVAGNAPAELAGRVEQRRRELTLAAELEDVRLQQALLVVESPLNDAGRLDFAAADRGYARVFRARGLAVEGEAPKAVAARIHDSALKAQLVAALDDWAVVTTDRGRRAWLLEITRRAEPGAWSDRFRDPAVWGDRAALERLASEPEVQSLSPPLLATLSVALRRSGANAVPLLKAAQRRHPSDFWLNFHLGNALTRISPAEAEGYFRAALAARPDTAAVYYNLGIALMNGGRLDEAATAARRAVALAPRMVMALNHLGLILYVQRKYGEAVAAYRQAIALDPRVALVYTNLGNALKSQGHLEEAVASHRKAIALNPKLALAHCYLGIALGDRGQRNAAEAAFRKALALNPKLALTHYYRGRNLLAQGHSDAALAAYRKAIVLDPRLTQVHFSLARALHDLRRWDEAEAAYRQTIALDPRDARAHNSLGVTLYLQGQRDAALAMYRTAIALDPRMALAHNNLGRALYDRGERKAGIAAYRQAIALDPKLALAHTNLGSALHDDGQLDEALASHRRAIALDPKLAMARNNLGNALCDLCRPEEAEAAFREAIAIDRRDADAHAYLGNALWDQGRLDEAVAAYRTALSLNNGLVYAHHNLALALHTQGQLSEAVAACRKALDLNPSFAPAHKALCRALASQGEFAQARDALRRWLGLLGPNDPRRKDLLQQIRQSEELLALAEKLPAFQKGTAKPATAVERTGVAQVCLGKQCYAAAARFFAEVFAEQPSWTATYRYSAACAAALAGCGRGKDAGNLDARERERWRTQAQHWLRADLDLYARQLASGKLANRRHVQQQLRLLLTDFHLAGVRGEEALARLPPDEQPAWRAFWAEVEALLKKTRPKTK
jgi:serine/threonine-protein kinase